MNMFKGEMKLKGAINIYPNSANMTKTDYTKIKLNI